MNRYFGHHTLEGEWHALLPRYVMLEDRVRGARVLDIGCGSGLGSSLLLEMGAKAVDAVDHRPGVLELARMKHAKQGLDFHVMLWEELDFPEGTFDLITCLDPNSPVTDPNLLREVRRLLKPHGQYVCAIERSPLKGMEALLPRYGYTETAERIELNEVATSKVPQVGELKRHFSSVFTLRQRPLYSFIFDAAEASEQTSSLPLERDEQEEEEVKPPQQSDSAAERSEPQDAKDDDASRPESASPQVARHAFYNEESEAAAVELWFCGEQDVKTPGALEVRLPYYRLMERLQHQVQALQARQRESSQQSFDELLEEGNPAALIEDASRTMEISRPFESEITQVKTRPLRPASGAAAKVVQSEQLDAHISALGALTRRVQTDFERVLFDAQSALDARHAHLDVLLDLHAKQVTNAQLQSHVSRLEAQLERITAERNHLLTERDVARAAHQGFQDAFEQEITSPRHDDAPDPVAEEDAHHESE